MAIFSRFLELKTVTDAQKLRHDYLQMNVLNRFTVVPLYTATLTSGNLSIGEQPSINVYIMPRTTGTPLIQPVCSFPNGGRIRG